MIPNTPHDDRRPMQDPQGKPTPPDGTAPGPGARPCPPESVDLHDLTDSMYAEARGIAGNIRKDWSASETLTPTALVNSSVVRMMESGCTHFNDRHHFRATVARNIFRELVDAKRAAQRQKRGGRDRRRIAWDDVAHLVAARGDSGFEHHEFLDDLVVAIERIAGDDHRNGEILKMKVLGGMNLEEIGHVLGISRSAVEKHWALVRRRVAALLEIDERDGPDA
jgi:RNA polymerase sigma factor (TIGR02999 family)